MPSAGSSKVQKNFDYASLDADTGQFVQQQTAEINVLMKQTAQGILTIGLKLLEVKGKLRHGQFGDWLAAEFEWSQDTASNFMHVAQHFGNNQKISEFAPSALYLLAAPSTPQLAREEAISRAEAGEKVTHKTAKALKQKYVSVPQKTDLRSQMDQEQLPPSSKASELVGLPSQAPVSESVGVRSQTKSTKSEIVALIPRTQKQGTDNQTTMNPQIVKVPLLSQQAPATEAANTWWSLDGKHLLFCGDPNSNDFLQRFPHSAALLLGFPAMVGWHTSIISHTSYIMSESVLEVILQKKGWQHLDELLEYLVLDCSKQSECIAICFLPLLASSDRRLSSSIILNLINRLLRRGIIAEPDRERCRAAIDDWKRSGGKVERLDSSQI